MHETIRERTIPFLAPNRPDDDDRCGSARPQLDERRDLLIRVLLILRIKFKICSQSSLENYRKNIGKKFVDSIFYLFISRYCLLITYLLRSFKVIFWRILWDSRFVISFIHFATRLSCWVLLHHHHLNSRDSDFADFRQQIIVATSHFHMMPEKSSNSTHNVSRLWNNARCNSRKMEIFSNFLQL